MKVLCIVEVSMMGTNVIHSTSDNKDDLEKNLPLPQDDTDIILDYTIEIIDDDKATTITDKNNNLLMRIIRDIYLRMMICYKTNLVVELFIFVFDKDVSKFIYLLTK